jgi:glycosyltransferase involved in cell wall biosynthesis
MSAGPDNAEVDPGKPRMLFLANARVVHAQRWIGYFREHGYPTLWLTFEDVPSGISAEQLPCRFFHRAGAILSAVPRIKAVIREFQPQLVNALFIPDYGWAGALSGFSPLVISAWGSDVLLSPRKSWLHRKRVSWAMSKADLLFADARVITDRMVELGADRTKIVTVPLGVESALLDHPRQGKQAGPGCTIITNRTFEPVYRNETFVEAAINLARTSAIMEFILIGEGSTRRGLEQRVRQAGLTDRIHFRDFMAADELYDTLSAADIYVSCSASDGTSVSLLEAMALGLYPIVTDIPANREWIAEGINGRLFPVGNAGELARMISEVKREREMWPTVIEKNKAIIRKRALWPDNMAEVERAMLKLIE